MNDVDVTTDPDRAKPPAMGDTVKYAQERLKQTGFKPVRVDRWFNGDVTVELGYVTGEVWFRAWRDPAIKLSSDTRIPNDLRPLFDILRDLGVDL